MADDINLADYLDGGDWLGIVLAAVAALAVGFLWFTVLFGKRWAAEMGMSMDEAPPGKVMALNMAKDLVGHFVMAYVLWHIMVAFLPEVWADHLGATAENAAMWTYGWWAAFFVWLGFFVPGALARTGWEGRSWPWFGIDVSYSLVKLVVMGQILAAFA